MMIGPCRSFVFVPYFKLDFYRAFLQGQDMNESDYDGRTVRIQVLTRLKTLQSQLPAEIKKYHPKELKRTKRTQKNPKEPKRGPHQ